MPGIQPSREFIPLCYEHHVKMRTGNPKGHSPDTQSVGYACTQSECLVRYNVSIGYFMLSQQASVAELEMVPKVCCPNDRAPMYLAEINPKRRNFRRWRCPQCEATLTNDEGLVAEKG